MKQWMMWLMLAWIKLPAQQAVADTFWLANTPVVLQQVQYGTPSGAFFIHLHANETASTEAANAYLATRNGVFAGLQHDTTRLVTFYFENRLIQFDPNRIFSPKGRMANLKLLNRDAPAAAEKIVGALADSLAGKFKTSKIIIAMHNNTDGKPLSVKNFKEKYVSSSMDTDDFILTTEKKIYDQLKKKKINAVLQTTKTSGDDGSLAIFCSKKKIPYINIEAQEDHIAQQLKMLEALTGIIRQYTR